MSGSPKRSHEEVGHSSSSKYSYEDVGLNPKLTSTVSNELQPHYEMGPDGRMAKIPHSCFHDANRKSHLLSMHRMPSSSNDLCLDSHPVPYDNRLDRKDSKEHKDHFVENQDPRSEMRNLHSEVKRDSEGTRGEQDGRFLSRGDDSKQTKYKNDTYKVPKTAIKVAKDTFTSWGGQLNWKEPKEYHSGKRYSESPAEHADLRQVARGNSEHPTETERGAASIEKRDHIEAHEAVSENKVDVKGEDRFIDKDRKRKEVRHGEWGERDKERSEHKSNMQTGCINNDGKQSAQEGRETGRQERERKDLFKDWENIKEGGKDQMKKESSTRVEKEILQHEKESGDGSKITEQESPSAEQKRQKDFDSLKDLDQEARDRRKERDADLERDGSDKRNILHDKELDDGGAEGEEATEMEGDVFNYGVQQRKRMLRLRGSPQFMNCDPRSMSCTWENEGSQAAGSLGKSEASSIVYKVGECMQDLIKLWKEYESSQFDNNGGITHNGPTLEIRIPAEHVTATNRQVRGGQLWGTDIYTDDSDLVAVLMHTGFCRPTASPPPPAIQELRATIRVLPPQDSYTSMLRNNVRSRAWGAGIGCSYRVEHCCIVKKGGGTVDVEPCLTYTSAVEPTLAPVAVEKTMTTRAAASNALRQQRFVREVTIQYNLCNEPWIKYSISVVADKGLKKLLYTSVRLKKGEVLYLETHSCRYELCYTGEKMVKATNYTSLHEETEKVHNDHPHSLNGVKSDSDSILIDAFRWSHCKKPLPQKVMRSVGIPLPVEYVEVLEDNLDWEEVQWSQTGVWVAGKEYTLARVHFLSQN